MSYSRDLRQRVIKFVENGGKKTEAARTFKIGRDTVYRWLKNPEAQPMGPKKSSYKLDLAALQQSLSDAPDAFLRERAERLGVTPQAVWCAMKKLNASKKNV